jgi:hypothetical protein
MFHFRFNVQDWPRAVAMLPDGYTIKAVDNVQMLAQVKSINPNLKTILRHFYTQQHPWPTDAENEQAARDFFDSFIDGTFINGTTHGWNHAQATDYIEDWNEYYGNGMPADERARFISWSRSAAKVWNQEYRTRPGLGHIKLLLANTAVGNDIPLAVARAASLHDALLSYHCYWPTKNNTVLPGEWPWYSGRWTQMDAHYRANGVTVQWALTEAGAVGYHLNPDGVPSLHAHDGWLTDDVHGGDIDQFLASIERWMNLWHYWNQAHGNRALAPNLFDSFGAGSSDWDMFQILQPNLDRIASFVQNWQPGEPEPPEPPEEPIIDFEIRLWLDSLAKQTMSYNPEAALQKVIFADGFVPVMNESRFSHDGMEYAEQAAEHLDTGERRVYYTEVGNWGNVRYITNPTTDGANPVPFEFEAWPTEYRVITQGFGENPDNYREFYGDDRGHQGIDIRAPMQSEIYSVAPGIVKMVYTQTDLTERWHNFGIHCRVSHRDGYETIYGHLQELSVRPGQRVEAGQWLGPADDSGNSLGSHLHLHLKKDGIVIDPTPFLESLL